MATESLGKNHNEKCVNLRIFNTFINKNYPNLFGDEGRYKLTEADSLIIYGDYDIFFRFLSLISGKRTSFNLEFGHYTVKNINWINSEENYKLVEWYIKHKDAIPCVLFNEYYNIEKAIREGPKLVVEDIDERMKLTDLFFDSIYNRQQEFERKYSFYLSEDSLKKGMLNHPIHIKRIE